MFAQNEDFDDSLDVLYDDLLDGLYNDPFDDGLYDYPFDTEAQKIGMSLGVLKEFGGDLKNQYDSIKWEQPGYRCRCHKDKKGFKPWRQKKQKTLKKKLFYPEYCAPDDYCDVLYDVICSVEQPYIGYWLEEGSFLLRY